MTGKTMFKLLLMGLLDGKDVSLRALESIYNSHEFNEYGEKGQQKTKHTTISDRLRNMNSDFFKRLFEEVSNKFKDLLNVGVTKSKVLMRITKLNLL